MRFCLLVRFNGSRCIDWSTKCCLVIAGLRHGHARPDHSRHAAVGQRRSFRTKDWPRSHPDRCNGNLGRARHGKHCEALVMVRASWGRFYLTSGLYIGQTPKSDIPPNVAPKIVTPKNYLWDSSATLIGQLAIVTLFGAILGGIPLSGPYPYIYIYIYIYDSTALLSRQPQSL